MDTHVVDNSCSKSALRLVAVRYLLCALRVDIKATDHRLPFVPESVAFPLGYTSLKYLFHGVVEGCSDLHAIQTSMKR